jgi:hypothetical protein
MERMRIARLTAARAVVVAGIALALTPTGSAQSDNKLVYADFEQVVDGRPVSNRGGGMQLFGYSENPTRPPSFRGAANLEPATPELVRTKADDPNRMGKFEYELMTPNQWSGVSLEIKGQADKDGKTPAEDLTGYKTLSVEVFSTGVGNLRVELLSSGWRIDLNSANPQITFIPKKGLNTYKVELKKFAQPSWVTDTRIDPKDVLKKLTAVSISAYCDDCRPTKGMLVIDNVIFEK